MSYAQMVPAFTLAGIGMSLFIVPIATVALSSVRPEQQGLASGTNNAVRELGGVLGIAVLSSVFASQGGYDTPQLFVHGITPALWVAVAALVLGALAGLVIPRRQATPVPVAPAVTTPAARDAAQPRTSLEAATV
jgi:hypothetical protein